MGIQIREANSEAMKKNIRAVQRMTKGMGFDENMCKVNWSFVRVISNFGYQFMPKEAGVKYTKIRLGSTKAIVSEYGQTNSKNIIMYIHGGVSFLAAHHPQRGTVQCWLSIRAVK